MQCLKEYTKPLAVAVKDNKTVMNFDGLLYMLGTVPMFVFTIILLILNVVLFLTNGMSVGDLLWNAVRYIVPTFLLPIFTGLMIMIIDKKPIRPMIKGLLLYPLFLGSWLLINFKCLFKRETSWEKIEHNVSKSIGDMKQ